jgi:23S rRNA (uracil1939-C5)-methyltransferase
MNYEVEILSYDHQGRGIGRINDKIIFIPNTIPGEIVNIKVTKDKKKFMEGEVINFIKESPYRVKDLCPYYETCGGCDLLHIPYSEQLKYKQDKVNNIIKRYVGDNIKINDIIPSDNIYHYRNKVTYHIDGKNIGFYEKKSNKIVTIDKCLLLDKCLNEYQVDSINNRKEIVLRTNVKEVLDNNKNKILINIGKYKYKVSLEAFFQVNTNVTYKMYEKIKEYANATNNDYVLDLYCGTGTIGIYVSDTCKEVLGIEINEQAIKDANDNKELNNITNIKFVASDVAKVIDKLGFNPSIILVDPPRAGLDNKTINEIIKMNPSRIVYTSCDPMTLARDLKILKEAYSIKEITPFDMFPNTYHVENVCLLERNEI